MRARYGSDRTPWDTGRLAYEHTFDYDDRPTVPDPVTDELLRLARLWISEGDAERLVGWIAARPGQDPVGRGGEDPMDRLERAFAHWLDDAQRRQLLRWLEGRLPRGLSPVPG